MLERTTACLKAGAARESLRCAAKGPRSKRLLHSTFWTHGAGDLDLPPWAVSMCPMPANLPLKHDDAGRGSASMSGCHNRGVGMVKGVAGLPDAGFLDFLYPPQALMWLQKTSGQQWHRREKRDMRRLPEGFIVASRGYASRSRGPSGPDQDDLEAEKEREATTDGTEPESGSYKPFDFSGNASDAEALEGDTKMMEGQADDLEVVKGQDASEEEDPDALHMDSFAASPADLAAEGYTNLRRLQSVLRSRKQLQLEDEDGSAELAEQAWTLFESLREEGSVDPNLRAEMLHWLGMHSSKYAHSRAAEVYHSIPTQDRTLQVYKSAASLFLRTEQFGLLSRLHKEALQSLENGNHISRTLIKHAVEHDQWQLAMQIQSQHHSHYSGSDSTQSNQRELFWVHVSQISQLLTRALRLLRYLLATRRTHAPDPKTFQFCAFFFREAVSQEFVQQVNPPALLVSGVKPPPRKRIRMLFRYATHLEEDAPNLFEKVLAAMLSPGSRFKYLHFHHVISFVYLQARRMKGFRPSKNLLLAMLRQLFRYANNRNIPRRSSISADFDVVLQDWKMYHGELSKACIMAMLTWSASAGMTKIFSEWLDRLRSTYPSYADQRDALPYMIYVHARRADLDEAQQAFATVDRIARENGDRPSLQCWNILIHAQSRADDLEGALASLQTLISHAKLVPNARSFHPIAEMMADRGDVYGLQDLLAQYDRVTKKRRHTALVGSLMHAHVKNGDVEEAEKILQTATEKVKRHEITGSLLWCFNILLTAFALRRDAKATMRTYHWMSNEKVQMDASSYASLIQSLAIRRDPGSAWRIFKVMRSVDIEPTGLHYAIAMAGFIGIGDTEMALRVHQDMLNRNVRPTASSNIAYLKAKAIAEHRSNGKLVLENVIEELDRLVHSEHGVDVAAKQPQTGLRGLPRSEANAAAYYDFLITIHGQRRCKEAIQELLERYQATAKSRDSDENELPLRMVASLIQASFRAGLHDDVEKYWQLAKEHAEHLVRPIEIPKLKDKKAVRGLNALDLQPVDLGDEDSSDTKETGEQSPRVAGSDTEVSDVQKAPRGRRHILSRALYFYITYLFHDSRPVDAIRTVVQVLQQGFTLDHRTWNFLLTRLCVQEPPLALLAFTLAERFLTPNFPGFVDSTQYPATIKARRQGLEYIRARDLPSSVHITEYSTLVRLAAAFIQLRRMDATGGKLAGRLPAELMPYVGTVRQVRQSAPRTLFIVQSLPKVPDRLQSTLLEHE